MNIPQQLQEQLKYPILQSIDPNTGHPQDENVFNALTQATLITFLAGLYKATRTKDNASMISHQQNDGELLTQIFGAQKEAVDTIVAFTQQPTNVVEQTLHEVANGYLELMRAPAHNSTESIKGDSLYDLMTSQRNEILKYVPSGLTLGHLLNDETIEDNTNKMQGPISTLMHKIEGTFSKSD